MQRDPLLFDGRVRSPLLQAGPYWPHNLALRPDLPPLDETRRPQRLEREIPEELPPHSILLIHDRLRSRRWRSRARLGAAERLVEGWAGSGSPSREDRGRVCEDGLVPYRGGEDQSGLEKAGDGVGNLRGQAAHGGDSHSRVRSCYATSNGEYETDDGLKPKKNKRILFHTFLLVHAYVSRREVVY